MQLIIFDIDGTLTQTFHSLDNSYIRALSRFIDIDHDYQYHKECPHPTDEGVFQVLFEKHTSRKPTEEDRNRMQDQFLVELMHKYRHSPSFFEEVPGAARFIRELQDEEDIVVAVATGNWERVARFKLELAGIDHLKLELIGSDDYHDKESFTRALIERLQQKHDFDAITYVGDSMYDYHTTRALGINFIGIDFLGKGNLDDLTFCPVYTDFREIRIN